jgi:hypothetical protein
MRDQVILADHALAIADEINQKVEDLRFESDKFGSVPQFLSVRIKRVVRESVDQGSGTLRDLNIPLQKGNGYHNRLQQAERAGLELVLEHFRAQKLAPRQAP